MYLGIDLDNLLGIGRHNKTRKLALLGPGHLLVQDLNTHHPAIVANKGLVSFLVLEIKKF
jgi:hypothetical protein